jgi:hypothetical protein
MMMRVGDDDSVWENRWAPYDEAVYGRVLEWVPDGAAVLDIGAGDLRLARRLARRVRVVYAIEQHAHLTAGPPLPDNLIVIIGDARALPFPPVDVAVLLMRHCRHFALYRRKLAATGCARLITNARWGLDVEWIDLTARPQPYAELALGWYACRCGATGFRPGPPAELTPELAETIFEVDDCPECYHGRNSYRLS